MRGSNEKMKSIFKDHMRDLYRWIRNAFCYSLEKLTGNKCEDYKIATNLIGGVFIISYSLGVFSLFFDIRSFFPMESQENNLATAVKSGVIKVDRPDNITSEKTVGCDLEEESWIRWYGEMNQGLDEKNYLTLPVNTTGTLFKYTGEIKDFSSCQFEFVPRSEKAINYLISIDDIYQIVVGDNDFFTVTLKATDSIGGDLIPINESVTQTTRPRLLSKIKNGTTVRVQVNQKFLDDENYQVSVEVFYKPDIEQDSTDTGLFSWVFNPSPAIVDSAQLSVGLLRGDGDTSEIGANFIYPRLFLE